MSKHPNKDYKSPKKSCLKNDVDLDVDVDEVDEVNYYEEYIKERNFFNLIFI